MTLQDHWEHIYQKKAPVETSWFEPHLQTSLHWISEAAPDRSASIIDVGGGESTLSDDLLAMHYRSLTVLDIAKAEIPKPPRCGGRKNQLARWECNRGCTSSSRLRCMARSRSLPLLDRARSSISLRAPAFLISQNWRTRRDRNLRASGTREMQRACHHALQRRFAAAGVRARFSFGKKFGGRTPHPVRDCATIPLLPVHPEMIGAMSSAGAEDLGNQAPNPTLL